MQTLRARINYAVNPEKTDGGHLVSFYECQPESAVEEFAASKDLYHLITQREREPSEDVLAYMIRQSFLPGEITPEKANEIGYALAMEFTKGEHQFIVATHMDKEHIHNHIIFNSTTLDCDRKFANPHQCGKDVARISDRLCRENGLSVVENPQQKGQTYKEWDARKKGHSWKARLQETIDRVIPDSRDFDDFLFRMREEGYEIKINKYLSFRGPGQERFTRSKTLGRDYTTEMLKTRLNNPRRRVAVQKNTSHTSTGKLNLLVDIKAKLQAGKGAGYERWAKTFNLKEAARTINYLTDRGLTDYDELVVCAEKAGQEFEAASSRIKEVEGRMSELSGLRRHIINYSKTRDIYAAYRKAKNKKAYRNKHKSEISMHEASKKAFDKLGGAKIPKLAEIQAEYSRLLVEKQGLYETYKTARRDMIDLQTAKRNVERILNIQTSQEVRHEKER